MPPFDKHIKGHLSKKINSKIFEKIITHPLDLKISKLKLGHFPASLRTYSQISHFFSGASPNRLFVIPIHTADSQG